MSYLLIYRQHLHFLITVDVAAPVNTYWGYGGDPELQISVNVTADDGWENITVSVRTPEGEIFPATTESSGSETSRIYSYTIKSLYIAYAGIYIFTAENIQDITITDSENVTVYSKYKINSLRIVKSMGL